jgi:DNA-binding winged helix-turn-helix (wHTH) protein
MRDSGVTAPISAWDRIELSRTPDFCLGPLSVRPSLREVRSRAQSLVLEPRVMRVLVALAERPGDIVGYEELIERCWDGRVIGDNAIHRVIGKLREMLSALDPGGALAIETVAKVGYRLAPGGEEAAAAPATAPPREAARRWPPPDTPSGRAAGPRGWARRAGAAGVDRAGERRSADRRHSG